MKEKTLGNRQGLWLAALLSICFLPILQATHNRAGEITYEQIGVLTIRATITTYTQTSSVQADRDSLDLFWGDGTWTRVGRANGSGDILPNDTKRNFYIAEHTYPGFATYHLSMEDPNRIAGILNVNNPNSVKIPFYIETVLTLFSNQFQAENSSAILLQPPIDFGCVGQRFVHNPNAFDPDGDSLSYELIVPLEAEGVEVPNYFFPDQINSGPSNVLTLNERTGDLIWDAPQRRGEYNVAIKIHEYRQGVKINTIIRDMQIDIRDCENQPPVIETVEEICVVAGDVVNLEVLATDADNPKQLISLTAIGGPLDVLVSPATFSLDGSFKEQPLTGVLTWQTECEHIASQPYSITFRAVDNFYDTTGLADLKTVRIKVVGPAPENLLVENEEPFNRITWDAPYSCEVTENDYFRGFTVWRRSTSNQFPIDTCAPGLEGKGYTPIKFGHKDKSGDRYTFLDEDVSLGQSFCYRVTASFAQISDAGYPFNPVEGLPSNESCAGFAADIPFLTKVSVMETSTNDGAILVEWTRPTSDNYDDLAGPFEFKLFRGDGMDPASLQPVTGAIFTAPSLASLIDTSFLDMTGLNTQDQAYTYQIKMSVGNIEVESSKASSVYLTAIGGDNKTNLSWTANVPWENYFYKIFRSPDLQSPFVEIGTSNEPMYTDEGLENGTEYCYYVEVEGTYGSASIVSPLLNLSQVTCAIPEDTEPPCPPTLTVINSCDSDNPATLDAFINRLSWQITAQNCTDPSDVAGFKIYYAPTIGAGFTLLEQISDPAIASYDHGSEFGIAGCYYVTSLDSLSNESDTSNNVCVDNCPFYSLPNTFTPNGDGANDLYRPFPYKFIDRIDLVIYNRWGQKVFETIDPDINWAGQNSSGKDLSQGVYHYTCRVFESRAQGIVENNNLLTGYIELVR